MSVQLLRATKPMTPQRCLLCRRHSYDPNDFFLGVAPLGPDPNGPKLLAFRLCPRCNDRLAADVVGDFPAIDAMQRGDVADLVRQRLVTILPAEATAAVPAAADIDTRIQAAHAWLRDREQGPGSNFKAAS